MNNLTFEAGSFSEQLGIYDFFNIIVSGMIFILGLCLIWSELAMLLWTDLSIPKGLTLVVIIYITGLVLQEISALFDKHVMRVQSGARYNFLKDSLDKEDEISPITWFYRQTLKKGVHVITKKLQGLFPPEDENNCYPVHIRYISFIANRHSVETPNSIIHNRLLLKHYRNLARDVLLGVDDLDDDNMADPLNMNYISSYMYSVCQYYVASTGKDKKVEKLRALFGMSRTLTVCFFLLFCSSLIFSLQGVDSLLPNHIPEYICIFLFLTIVFRFRMNKTIRYMTLIMLGNYDALLRHSQTTGTSDESP